ncbi:hypothetical protein TrVE_jg6322 [Triparma verrucosa]|uniref:Pyrrolo-quinoline quinone repeat domain-containing protein n=1 Tax=Triparma verrucosa TaxID=1606542 RepID=A0A9W7EZ87_9STRA|nr:hypothetical protein TrVE_jg6322 [Triparma verrucosa]
MPHSANARNIICASKETPLCFCVKGTTVQAINSVTGEQAKTYCSGEGNVTCLAMNPDLDVMVYGDENGLLVAQASKTGNKYWSFELRSKPVALVATDLLTFICLEVGRVEARWLTDGDPLWKKSVTMDRPTCMELVGHALVLCTNKGEVICLNTLDGSIIFKSTVENPTPEDMFQCMSGDEEMELLALGNVGGEVVCRLSFEDKVVWKQDCGSSVTTVDLNGTKCITGSASGIVSCWNVENGNMLWQGVAFGRVCEVEIAENIGMVLSCGDSKAVQMWELSTGEQKWTTEISNVEVETVEYDGENVIFGCHFGSIYYVDSKDGSLKWRNDASDEIVRLSLSSSIEANNDLIGFGRTSGKASVFSLASHSLLFNVNAHHREIVAMALTEVSTAITGSNDFSVRCTGRRGKEHWMKRSKSQPTTMLTVADSVVVGYRDGTCHCLSIHDGEERWALAAVKSNTLRQLDAKNGLSPVKRVKERNESSNEPISTNYEGDSSQFSWNVRVGELISLLFFDSNTNCILVVKSHVSKRTSKLSCIKANDGKPQWEIYFPSNIIMNVQLPGVQDAETFKNLGMIVLKAGLLAFDRVTGELKGSIFKSKKVGDIVAATLAGGYLIACSKSYVHVAEYREQVGHHESPFRILWKSKKIGQGGATIHSCEGYKNYGAVICTGNEILVVDLRRWKHPYVWSVAPSGHEDPITLCKIKGRYLYTISTIIVRHRITYAFHFDGMSIFKEVAKISDADDDGGGEGGDENETATADENPQKTKESEIEAVIEYIIEHKNMYEYRSMQILSYALFVQRCGFAFKNIEAPISFEEISDLLGNLTDIMVVLPGFNYLFVFVGCCSIVTSFLIAFVVQEWVEFKKFMEPNSKALHALWGFLSALCEACSGFFAVPILTYLLKMLKCEERAGELYVVATLAEAETGNDDDDDAGMGEATIDLSGGLSGDYDEIICWQGDHLVYTVLALFACALYLPMAVRFIRVDKKLDCIEAKTNFFDWKSDTVMLEERHHAFSLIDTTAERASFMVGVLLTTVSTFVDSDFAGVVIDFTIQCVFVITTHIHLPHFDKKTNHVAILLAWSTLYIFASAIVVYLLDDPKHVLVNVIPLLMPVIVIGGILMIYFEDIQVRWRTFRAQRKSKGGRNRIVKRMWEREQLNKVYIDREPSKVGGTAKTISSKIKKNAVGASKFIFKGRAQQFSIFGGGGGNTLDVEEGSTSSSDEDEDENEVVESLGTEFVLGRRKNRAKAARAKATKVTPEDEIRMTGWQETLAFRLTFLCLLFSMIMLVSSGMAFFYGAKYDNVKYVAGTSASWIMAIVCVLCNSGTLVVANYIKTQVLNIATLFASLTAAQQEFYLLSGLNNGVECLNLPVNLKSVPGNMQFGYKDGGGAIGWINATSPRAEKIVVEERCPIGLGDGGELGISQCDCCGDTNSGGDLSVFSVLHNGQLFEDELGHKRIEECLCFSASNFVCDFLMDESGAVDKSSNYYMYTQVSFYAALGAMVTSLVIVLLSVKATLFGVEEFFRKQSIAQWKRWKEEKVKMLKRTLLLARGRDADKVDGNLFQDVKLNVKMKHMKKLQKDLSARVTTKASNFFKQTGEKSDAQPSTQPIPEQASGKKS